MTDTKRFHIGTILTITDGKLISPDHIDGVYQICDWVTEDTNYTHQLPRVADEIAPFLREQFPDLAAIVVPDGLDSMDAVRSYLASLAPTHGVDRDVPRMPAADHTPIDPVAELHMNHPGVPVITITTEQIPGGDAA